MHDSTFVLLPGPEREAERTNIMENSHPFGWLTVTGHKRALIVLVILTVGIIIGQQILGAPLKTDVALGLFYSAFGLLLRAVIKGPVRVESVP